MAPSLAGRPGRQLAARACVGVALRARAPTAARTRRRRHQAPRQPHADARPVDARGVLAHVAAVRHRDDRAPQTSARASVPWPTWQTITARVRHRARVREPVDERRAWRRRATERASGRRLVVASTRTGRSRKPGERGAQHPLLRDPARSTARPGQAGRARGQRHVVEWRLPQHRPDDVDVRGPITRVLELREASRRCTARC